MSLIQIRGFIEGCVAKVTIFRDAFESFDLVRTPCTTSFLAICGDALILVLGAGEKIIRMGCLRPGSLAF